jgi:ABC-type antimicrobial peptide transport system permease subunit
MKRSVVTLLSLAIGSALIVLAGAVGFAQSRKPSTLPTVATDTSSTASRVATMMVVIEEQGVLASEPKATCDNRPSGGKTIGRI